MSFCASEFRHEERPAPVECTSCHELATVQCEECRGHFCEDHAIALEGAGYLCLGDAKRFMDIEDGADLVDAERRAA